MNPFKVGDKVKINMVNTCWHDIQGEVTRIDDEHCDVTVTLLPAMKSKCLCVHHSNLTLLKEQTPAGQFKVGDRVMFSLEGSEDQPATIDYVNVSGIYYGIKCDKGAKIPVVHFSRLKLIESSFIKQVIDGAKVQTADNFSLKDFEFCGYAIKSSTEWGDYTYLINKGGDALRVFSEEGRPVKRQFKFEIQPEKVVWHTIAVRDVTSDHLWNNTILSDDELNKAKHNWREYKILDTWYE